MAVPVRVASMGQIDFYENHYTRLEFLEPYNREKLFILKIVSKIVTKKVTKKVTKNSS